VIRKPGFGTLIGSACLARGLVAGPAAAQMAPWEATRYEAAEKEKESTVHTSHHDTESISRLCNGFEKPYPGVKCNCVRTTAQVAFQRLQQDLQAEKAVATVFSSTDVSHYPALGKAGADAGPAHHAGPVGAGHRGPRGRRDARRRRRLRRRTLTAPLEAVSPG
jgi:ABC-type glycerol-3-phosphate transport system substrate-binding protein